MKMSKLSNQTNSQDPQAVNSRVFVGNLNTFQCSKADVERMFQRYGRLVGISMHKGYAFVQFTNPFDARNACHGEDARTILSQVLDVNMVAEPKPHQIGRKRQNVTKTGNDWDYYYDSYCASSLLQGNSPRPLKRQRLMTHQNRTISKLNISSVHHQQQQAAVVAAAIAAQAAAVQQANLLPQQLVLNQHGQPNHLVATNGTNVNGLVAQQCNNKQNSAIVPHPATNNFPKNFLHTSTSLNNKQHQQQQQQQQQQQRQLTEQLQIATENLSNLVNCDQQITTNGITSGMIVQNGTNGHCSPQQLLLQQHHHHQQQQHQQHQQQQHHQHHQQQQQQLQQYQNFQLKSQSTLDNQNQQQQQYLAPFKVYSNLDTLICGNCRECFTDLGELLEHKRSYCKLRFTCKCQDSSSPNSMSKNPLPTTKLLCAVCKDAFINPWDLMVHAQAAHMVNIYELGNEENNNGLSSNQIITTTTSATSTVATITPTTTISTTVNFDDKIGIMSNNNSTNTMNNMSTSIHNIYNNDSSTLNVQNQQQQQNIKQQQQQQLQQKQILNAGQPQNIIRSNHILVNGNSCEKLNRICNGDLVENSAILSVQHQLNNRLSVQSPDGFIIKEDNHSHSDDTSLDGRMSSASTAHQSEDMKMNGSMSSRDNSPILESKRSKNNCIAGTLNIDTTSNLNSPPSSIDMMTTNLAIALAANGTPVSTQ